MTLSGGWFCGPIGWSPLNYSFDDSSARAAELLCKRTEIHCFLANAQAIELNEFCVVQFDRDSGPKSVEVVGVAIGRYSERDDRGNRQVEGTRGGVHGGA